MTSGMTETDSEPRLRLRMARENLGLSTGDVARLIGRSASTVRAHEAGQNQIRPDIASNYAAVLGVTPDWLLFGAGEGLKGREELQSRVQQVPIMGRIHRGIFTERWPEVQKYTHVFVTETNLSSPMEAYILDQDIPGYTRGSLIIAFAVDYQQLRHGDDAIFIRERGELAEFTLRRIIQERPGEAHLLNFPCDGRPAEVLDLPLDDEGDLKIAGEVIMTCWYKYHQS